MYDPDQPGELLETKRTTKKRTFDEQNAFASYGRLIGKIYWAPGDSRNAAGFTRLKNTKSQFSPPGAINAYTYNSPFLVYSLTLNPKLWRKP